MSLLSVGGVFATSRVEGVLAESPTTGEDWEAETTAALTTRAGGADLRALDSGTPEVPVAAAGVEASTTECLAGGAERARAGILVGIRREGLAVVKLGVQMRQHCVSSSCNFDRHFDREQTRPDQK